MLGRGKSQLNFVRKTFLSVVNVVRDFKTLFVLGNGLQH